MNQGGPKMQLIKKSFSIMKPWLNNNICNKMVVGICTVTNKEICLLNTLS